MITFTSLVDYSSIKVSGESLDIGSGFYLHVIGYFIAAFLFYLVLSEKQHGKMIVILLILFGCGIVFEIVQGYLPKRTYNPMDFLANGLGLAAFYGLHWFKSSRKGAEGKKLKAERIEPEKVRSWEDKKVRR
jgi:VanZ family protein